MEIPCHIQHDHPAHNYMTARKVVRCPGRGTRDLTAYVFTNELFCYVAVVLAGSEEEARELGGEDVVGCDLAIMPLQKGLLVTGGGNG